MFGTLDKYLYQISEVTFQAYLKYLKFTRLCTPIFKWYA